MFDRLKQIASYAAKVTDGLAQIPRALRNLEDTADIVAFLRVSMESATASEIERDELRAKLEKTMTDQKREAKLRQALIIVQHTTC